MLGRKFAIVGCEHVHIEIFIEEMLGLGYECVGIYEPNNVELAKSVASKWGIPHVEDEQLVYADDVPIIGSAAVNSEKINVIERCEQLGKHVMVDKPAVTNRQDYERLQAVVNRGQIKVGMLLTERFNPANYTLKSLIDQGELGELISFGIRKPHRLRPQNRPAWFFSKEQCGGIIIDLLVHDFDLLRWLTGREIAHIDGYMSKSILPEYPGFYDVTSLQVVMDNNVTAQLYADWFTPEQSWTWGDCRLFVTGTEGFAELRLSGDPFVKEEPLLLLTTNKQVATQYALMQPATSISEDFLRYIAGEETILTSDDVLLAAKSTIDADEQARIIHAMK